MRSKKKIAEEKRQEMHFVSDEEKEKRIEDYLERETAGARKPVEDADGGVQQEQDDVTHAEIAGLPSRESEKTFEEMRVAIGDSLSDLASSYDGEDGEEDDDEETELGNLSEDDEPGWVMDTITKEVEQRFERFHDKQMKLDKLTQPGSEVAADNFAEQDKKYSTTELRLPAIVQPQTQDDAPAPPLATFGEQMENLDIIPGISQKSQGTSRPGSCHIRLCLAKPQSILNKPRIEPAAEPDLSMLLKAKPVEPVSFYPSI
jgi:hypothetical protein